MQNVFLNRKHVCDSAVLEFSLTFYMLNKQPLINDGITCYPSTVPPYVGDELFLCLYGKSLLNLTPV